MIETLFDYAAAREGIRTSSEHAGDEWKDYAIDFVRGYLREHRELFVDDLWKAGLREPSSLRALGAVMQHAARHDWMEQQRRDDCVLARPSQRSNGQLKPVWRSRIYDEKTR